MRILDKYLLREFLWPVLYCFDAFLMLLVLIDLFGSLDEFIEHQAPVGLVLRYYVWKLPEMFVLVVPMSLLLGVLFCLSNLGRHHELIAMRAGGLSLGRTAAPLLAVGAAGSLLVFAVSELVLPGARERAEALMLTLKGRGRPQVLENFFYSNPLERRDWYARRFNAETGEMENPEVHDRRADGTPELLVYAARARWVDGGWMFFEARVNGAAPVPVTNFPSIRDSPRRLALAAKKPEQLTSSELRRHIRVLQRAGHTAQLPKYQVALHTRYSFPLTCLVVVWIGIPLGMQVGRAGPLLGVGTALALVVTFYFLNHITVALGEGGHIPPVAAAWLTNAIFAAVGAGLFVHAR